MKSLKSDRGGIALIELLVYLSIVVLLSNLLFIYYARTQAMIRASAQQGLKHMRWYAVLDLIKHEFRQAPAQELYWQVTESQRLIWEGYDGRSYSFEVHHNKLYKVIGSYEPIIKHWRQPHKTILLENVSMSFSYEWITIGGYRMLYAITLLTDTTRSQLFLANQICSVPHA